MVVFLPEDHKLPPNEYKEADGITESLVKDEIESAATFRWIPLMRFGSISSAITGEAERISERACWNREHDGSPHSLRNLR